MDDLNSYFGVINQVQEANNAWSAEQAQKQMDFQERMSNTAHQREVADLKAAGLNPVLSAGGSGATTGSGAMANRSDANLEAIYGLLSKAFDAQIENAKSEQVSAAAMASGNRSSGIGISALEAQKNKEKDRSPAETAAAEYAKRKLGIDVDTFFELLDSGKELWNDFKHGMGYETSGTKKYKSTDAPVNRSSVSSQQSDIDTGNIPKANTGSKSTNWIVDTVSSWINAFFPNNRPVYEEGYIPEASRKVSSAKSVTKKKFLSKK